MRTSYKFKTVFSFFPRRNNHECDWVTQTTSLWLDSLIWNLHGFNSINQAIATVEHSVLNFSNLIQHLPNVSLIFIEWIPPGMILSATPRTLQNSFQICSVNAKTPRPPRDVSSQGGLEKTSWIIFYLLPSACQHLINNILSVNRWSVLQRMIDDAVNLSSCLILLQYY